VREVFKYSSNIGTAKIALAVGAERQRRYFDALGLLDRVETELPEGARPLAGGEWAELVTATRSYGHGIAVTPMHLAAAGAAVLNGGMHAPPTFYPRTHAETMANARRVIGPRASAAVRELFKLNAAEGSGKSARVPGYDVGGKTGTAEKAVAGGYADDERINTFLAAFPMDDPQYVAVVVLDDPRRAEDQPFATAGWNAAPTTANIISRIGPMLVTTPRFEEEDPVARALDVALTE
jgi:cell division protein FtsI (penicillin-binding protein 3)